MKKLVLNALLIFILVGLALIPAKNTLAQDGYDSVETKLSGTDGGDIIEVPIPSRITDHMALYGNLHDLREEGCLIIFPLTTSDEHPKNPAEVCRRWLALADTVTVHVGQKRESVHTLTFRFGDEGFGGTFNVGTCMAVVGFSNPALVCDYD